MLLHSVDFDSSLTSSKNFPCTTRDWIWDAHADDDLLHSGCLVCDFILPRLCVSSLSSSQCSLHLTTVDFLLDHSASLLKAESRHAFTLGPLIEI